MTTVTGLLIQATLLALAVLLMIAFVLGVAVVLRPQLLDRLQQASGQRYSMRRATRSLDIPRNVDRWFYRYHRVYGTVVILLSIALLSFLAFGNTGSGLAGLFEDRYRNVGGILIEAATLMLWILCLFTLLVGTVVLVRPSALLRLEAHANRWLTPRRAMRGLEREYHAPQTWVRRYPRRWGIAIAVASAACLLALILHAPSVLQWAG